MRPACLALMLAVMAACARPPPAADTVPPSPLARAALAEWEAWGRVTVAGWPATRPSDTAATDDRFARLLQYWSVVPGGAAMIRRHLALRENVAVLYGEAVPVSAPGAESPALPSAGLGEIGLYAYPAWSAAFISAMARRAGIPEGDLPSSSRHTTYIDAVLTRHLTEPDAAPFRPESPELHVPRSGDLLCADRSAQPLAHWTMRLSSLGRPRAMHCDVVIRTRPGVVEAIGGNVQGLVVLRQFPGDNQGRLLPAPAGEFPFVVILAAHR